MRKLQNRHSICAVLVIFVCGAIIVSFLHADTPLRPSNNPPTEAKRATDSTKNTRKVVAKRTDLSKRLTAEEMKAAQLSTCIQPSYDAWEQITVGMPESKVRELLGEPIHYSPPPQIRSPNQTSLATLVYGEIDFNHPSMPQPFQFGIDTANGKVLEKGEPFNAPLSKSDKPSTPVPMSPIDGVKFRHYPRFLDLRWYPSSGAYPIEYVVEVQWGNNFYKRDSSTGKDRRVLEYSGLYLLQTKVPYAVWSFVGSNPGRWRVEAKNAYGVSDWSEWRTFDFSAEPSKPNSQPENAARSQKVPDEVEGGMILDEAYRRSSRAKMR